MSSDVSPAGRPWARIVLGTSVLVLLPLILALAVMAAKFRGLGVNQAMEQAQIARHVAVGDGLVTDSLRPVSLAIQPSLKGHPDLYHPPLPPLLLGLTFALTHPSDRAAAALGLLLWVATIVLTFLLARRWFGLTVAWLAAAFAACNIGLLKAALLGMPYPLAALLLLLQAMLAAPAPRRADEPAPPGEDVRSDLRIAGVAVLGALAALSHYLFFFLAPAVGIYLVLSRRRRGRAALIFGLGFAVATLPWMIRNFHWGRSPFFSLYWFEALAGTDTWPGDTVWRSMAAASTGPWEFAFSHPFQMIRKMSGGALRFWSESLSVTDPVVTFLFASALFSRRDRGPWRGWLVATTVGLLLTAAASCVFRAEPELLLCWTPLLAIPAAAQVVAWTAERMEQVSLRRYWSIRLIPSLFQDPKALRLLLYRGVVLAILIVVAFPLWYYVWVARSEPAAAVLDTAAFAESVPPEAVVMTDQPALVAWKGERRAVWLPLEEGEWDRIEARGGRIDVTYITPMVNALLPASKASWWWWIASPRGVYRDLTPADAGRLPGVLRLKGRG
jgi:4-amino-4-deoxy-L-arabinose transferase-like glycosyltransferase